MSIAKSSGWKSVFAKHETILLLVLVAEILFFNSVGRNFGTAEIGRAHV